MRMQQRWSCACIAPKVLLVGEPVVVRAPEPRAGVRRMKEYHPPVAGRDGLRLDFNENTLACSPRVIEALKKITAADLTRYPERGSVEVRVADSLGVTPAEVLLTNGVDEAIHVLCQAFLDRGDAMLLPVPTYSMYEVYGSAAEAQIDAVPAWDSASELKTDAVLASHDLRFPLDAMLAAIHERTRVIAIANPNSPTGATVSRNAIIAVAERAPQAIVLVDEAYYHFYGETVLDLIGKVPNLVVARTFSKAYGLAGLRLGALIAAEETMQWLRRVISPYSVNQLALLCLPAALEDRAYLDWYVAEVKNARRELAQALTECGLEHWPSEANFILTRIGSEHGAFVKTMRTRGILTRDRSADPGCDGLVRITVGTREQMRQAKTAMESSLKEVGWRA
jgi:histidinol-phosphate aminotransferase